MNPVVLILAMNIVSAKAIYNKGYFARESLSSS